jgi:hypothetical protein
LVDTAAKDELASNAGKTPPAIDASLSEVASRPEIENCSEIEGPSDVAGCFGAVNFSNTTSFPEMSGCPEKAGFSETTKDRTEAATVAEVKKLASNRKGFPGTSGPGLRHVRDDEDEPWPDDGHEGQPTLICLSALILS